LNYPIITILHSIPGRVRIQFSHRPLKGENLAEKLTEDSRVFNARYTPLTATMVIQFNHRDIELLHILKRIVLQLSEEYNMQPVYIHVEGPNQLSPLTKASAVTILFAGLVYVMSPGTLIAKVFGTAAAITTAAAVLEHAMDEINHRGTFDPEALSIVYLVNSVASGEFVRGAFFTWLASFSRHLLHLPQHEGLKVSVVEGRDRVTGNKYKDIFTRGSIPMNPDLSVGL
jgi:hypothetical protein